MLFFNSLLMDRSSPGVGVGQTVKFGMEMLQGRAQSFFDNRMVKRHFKHLRDCHFALQCPGKKMRQMLGGRSQHFRAQKAVSHRISVDIQQALVFEQDTRTALILETRLTGSEGTGFH